MIIIIIDEGISFNWRAILLLSVLDGKTMGPKTRHSETSGDCKSDNISDVSHL